MRFQNLPIKQKLVGVILVTSLSVLLLTSVVLLSYEIHSYRQTAQRNLSTVAGLIAANSTVALMYDDQDLAHEILGGLRAEPSVTSAALYDLKGHLYAAYPTNLPPAGFPREPEEDGSHIENQQLRIFQPAIQSHKRVGTVYLSQSLEGMYHRLAVYAGVLLTVFACSAGLAFLISHLLQQGISRPVLELAATAKVVRDRRDYSIRATKINEDELGFLTESFNSMLDQIQLNITQLRVAESALVASEHQLRLVTDNAQVFLVQVDRHYVYKFVNRTYAGLFGREPRHLIGQTVAEVVGAAAFETFRHHMDAALAGQRVEFELEIPYATLGPRWVHAIYEPERTPDDEVIGLVGVSTDISRRKLDEVEMMRARDEALAASRAKDNFIATLSHELRTPLNPALLLASERAADPQVSDPVRADFATIRNCVELEARLIDDLLDLTRITRGKVILELHPVDAQAILQDALSTIEAELGEKQIKLVTDFGASTPLIQGDAVRLQQVFWNIMKNAVKFTPAGGTVTIRTRRSSDGRNLVLEFADSGIGMTPAELERVFTAFSQGDHAGEGGSHRFGGVGLGLAISRTLVELHSGSIEASSPGRDQGASIVITLPLLGAASTRSESRSSGKPASAAAPARASRRILLVEDHEPTRTALAGLLMRRNYCVVSSGSADEARRLAAEGNIDLVISDIGLPDGNGNDLMAELRSEYGLHGIALTGYGMEQDLARSQMSGFIAHLTKPVRVQTLEAALAAFHTKAA